MIIVRIEKHLDRFVGWHLQPYRPTLLALRHEKLIYKGTGKLPAAVIRALGPEGPEGEYHCPEGPKGLRVVQMCEPEGTQGPRVSYEFLERVRGK